MRPRLGRITHPSDFSDILKQGERSSRQGIVLISRPNSGFARLGFAVGRAAGNAVQRNRFRRVIREFLRHQSLPNIDMVIMVRAPISKSGNAELRDAMRALLQKRGWIE
ncbi:MAG: ribonuclease P protein component [Deltaproteobacteria bacterium CG11_big_fil_rev_8_21_14_0_20_47_16]|nr:MAG: ribonuclease P protein component [Deltaproteobacteria bacterium CG11_big_fil_rev_8_21_14_0_20_47_16]